MGNGFLDPEEITKLGDLHVELFRDALDVKPDYDTIPGHPVHTYLQENLEAANLNIASERRLKLVEYLLDLHFVN